jgi:formylglycine-generating enzyme required for sulfatase activity
MNNKYFWLVIAIVWVCIGLVLYIGPRNSTESTPATKSRKAAEQGDAKAQYELGRIYDEGKGVQKEEAQAVNWYQKAAVPGATYTSLTGLASGSKQAQAAQKSAVSSKTPLEVKLKKTGIAFRLIPAGSFMMGRRNGARDEKPTHRITLTKPFYMGKFEVTQGQWEKVMGTRPWSGYRKTHAKSNSEHAVSYVNGPDAQSFIKKLEALEGLPAGTLQLPTEPQWEYACRAGTSTTYIFGDKDSSLGDYAWYGKNALDIAQKYAHAVGQKKPNAFGLYDMHGNVWELCLNWYTRLFYQNSPETNALRGGSLGSDARLCRSAGRSRNSHHERLADVGFRLSLDSTK